jgi:hypothetical protein
LGKLVHRLAFVIFFVVSLASCTEVNDEETSASLEMYLENLDLECTELTNWDFSSGFLVKKELDGWGVLIISQSDKPNYYDLSLVSHMHERAFLTRNIVCK